MPARDELLALSRALLDPIPSPAALLDHSGAVLLDNPAFREACGHLASAFQLDPGMSRRGWGELLLRLQEGDLRLRRSLQLRDGARPAELHLQRLCWGDEELIYALLEVPRAAATAEGLLQTERMASMGALAAGVAHEIKNPLTWVLGNLTVVSAELADLQQALPQRAEQLAELRAALGEAQDGASRVANIIQDLNTFARADESSLAPVDLEAVVQSAANMVESTLRQRATIQRELRELPPILGNEARLGQVFVNLLINAVHAVEGSPDASVRVEARSTPGQVRIDVVDNGPGIPAHVLPRIYDPFFTTKALGVGTGLGLAICQSIVANLGGRLEVAETGVQGTRMRVILPILDLPDTSNATTISLPPIDPPAEVHLLIVDDEPLVCSSLRRSLASLGRVSTATSVQDALAQLADLERVDVILCDLMMPGLGGIDLYEALGERHPELLDRVLFMTGGAFTVRVQRFIHEGHHAVMHKPPDLTKLKRLVLSRAGAARRTR